MVRDHNSVYRGHTLFGPKLSNFRTSTPVVFDFSTFFLIGQKSKMKLSSAILFTAMVGASVEAGKKKNKNNDAIEKPEFQCPECSG